MHVVKPINFELISTIVITDYTTQSSNVGRTTVMRRHTSNWQACLGVALLAFPMALFSSGCGGDDGNNIVCGAGTRLEGSECLTELFCGEGTQQENNSCVPTAVSSLACGSGTTQGEGDAEGT